MAFLRRGPNRWLHHRRATVAGGPCGHLPGVHEVPSGRRARCAPEATGEVRLIGEAELRGDISQGKLAGSPVSQLLSSDFDSKPCHVLVHRMSCGELEEAHGIVGASADERGQRVDSDVARRIRFLSGTSSRKAAIPSQLLSRVALLRTRW
jgi:hypothetical protein